MRVRLILLCLLALSACGSGDAPEEGPAADNAVVGPAPPGPPYAEGTINGSRYVPCPEGHQPKPLDPQVCVPVERPARDELR